MELLLNILFLVIALGTLATWRTKWLYQERPARRAPLQEWTAFVCALVFVFFAVSLSDDLRADVILGDGCASERRHSLAWDSHHGSHQQTEHPHALSACPPSRVVFCANLQIAGHTVPTPAHVDRGFESRPSAGRSPPLASNLPA